MRKPVEDFIHISPRSFGQSIFPTPFMQTPVKRKQPFYLFLHHTPEYNLSTHARIAAIVKSEAGKFNLRVSSMAVANTISVGHGS